MHKPKTLDVADTTDAKEKIKDVEIVGDPDTFRLICKASSEKEGWMKSTKGMQTAQGVVIQVSTQQRNPDGSYAIAEALTFVPKGQIVEDPNVQVASLRQN